MTDIQRQFDEEVSQIARSLFDEVQRLARELERKHQLSGGSGETLIMTQLRNFDRGLYTDGRAALWRARLRLYRAADNREPVADSDAGKDAGQAGETLHLTLPALCHWISELASNYHGTPLIGMDPRTLKSKERTVRTQMSLRKDGTGVLTIDYRSQDEDMIARCDIVRVTQTDAETARHSLVRLTPR